MFSRNGALIKDKYKEYLIPTLFMTVALYLASVIDGIMVSWLIGSDGLSAINLNAPVVYIINTIFTIFITGSTTLISIAKGEREEGEVNKIFTVTVIAGLSIDVLLIIIGAIFLTPLSVMLSQGGSLQALTQAYLWPLIVCAPFVFISLGFANYVRVDGHPKLAAAVSVVANAVNLICDFIFITVFNMGIAGAGWATITGYIVGFLILVPYLLSKTRTLRFTAVKLPDFSRLKEILTTGFPGALSQGLAFVRTLALNMLILKTFGAEGMAVFAVCLNTMNFALMFIRGASDTMVPIGGFLYGDRDAKGLTYLIKVALMVAVFTSALLLIIFEFFPQAVAVVFNLSTSVDLFKDALRIYAFCIPLFAVNYLFLCFYQTTKKRSIATAISVLEGFVIVVGAAY
ncbi:MAG: MATE family efflux transporter, partial [Eubacterium sp.]